MLLQEDLLDRFIKKRTVSNVLRILIPLYTTYTVFLLSVFFLFIPRQEDQLVNQKKQAIVQLTESAISILAVYEKRVQKGEISLDKARSESAELIRNLRYGPEGKDYFWINDMHPFMVMHPYRVDLEGQDLTFLKDPAGNFPFLAMVEKVLGQGGGFVNYYWQWRDMPDKVVPKLSFVKGFAPWGWIVGTGLYQEEIRMEIDRITRTFFRIFTGVLVFIILLSIYITRQVVLSEQLRSRAERARNLEELRLKSLLELSEMPGRSLTELTRFALEEAIALTQSEIGYLAFMSPDETELTMHTWSEKAMAQCAIKDRILTYKVEETGLWAAAARTREPVMVNDYKGHPDSDKTGCPQGHVAINRLLSVPVFDNGKIVALAGVGNKETDYDESDIRQLRLMMDGMWRILEKSRAETQLKESEARYRILADNATDMIWILDIRSRRFTYVSPAIEVLLGYTAREFIGLEMGRHMSQTSMAKVGALIEEELGRDREEGVDPVRYQTVELELRTRQGEQIWAEVTARFLRDEDGQPDRILGITRDVTQRKTLERQLKEINTDLCLAQRIAGIGNWSIHPDSGKRFWSEEVFRIYERDLDQGPCPFEELSQIYASEHRDTVRRALAAAMDQGQPFDMEFKLNLPSGTVKWVHAICNPERLVDSERFFLRGTLQDITHSKEMAARIQQTQKMEALGTLAGGIAHDFNNILSSMIGFAELAKRKLDDRPEIQNKLGHVITGGLRARDLVKHILIFSRKADVQRSPIKVGTLIKESLKFMRASLPPSIEIRHQILAEESVVLGDPTQIHQVLMNLLTNAAHAMKDQGGVLGVRLETVLISEADLKIKRDLTAGPHVRITVTDTGCGIPKGVISKIFEPFFTTKARGEGTGMGLSLVYGIVREMGGTISVYSEPGKGAAFTLLIPQTTGPVSEEEGAAETEPEGGRGRILLVDDEPGVLSWTSQALENQGYVVTTANRGASALGLLKQNPSDFDLVLTDLAMPGMTGLELAQQIRQLRLDLPIVLCTGFSEGLSREGVKALGITDLVMKPMIAGELAKVVRQALAEGGGHGQGIDH